MPLRSMGCVISIVVALSSLNVLAQEFSASVISGNRYAELANATPPAFGQQREEKPPERLYFGDNKARIDIRDGQLVWMLDFNSKRVLVLDAHRRIFSERPLRMPLSAEIWDRIKNRPTSVSRKLPLTPNAELEATARLVNGLDELYLFRTTDVDNACPDWFTVASDMPGGRSCRKVGDDVVDGRVAIKYEALYVDGKKSNFWLDRKLRIAIKWKDPHGSGSIKNIQEGLQPSALFEIPADYQKGVLAISAETDVP